jgi:hypothetical protein
MELPVSFGPGGMRYVTTITSSAATALDLSAFAGMYVELETNEASFISQIPSTGTFTFSTSGAVTTAGNPTSGALVPKKLAADTTLQFYVAPQWPRLLVQAQSTDVTEVVVKSASVKVKI